ncbi:MAG TPA: FMN-binding negative transcriptional regulator, partial [Paracoccaceae bacterium]
VSNKMTPGAMERMMRMIQPFLLALNEVQSTVKLNQNKTESQRQGAAQGIAAAALGLAAADLAALMTKG